MSLGLRWHRTDERVNVCHLSGGGPNCTLPVEGMSFDGHHDVDSYLLSTRVGWTMATKVWRSDRDGGTRVFAGEVADPGSDATHLVIMQPWVVRRGEMPGIGSRAGGSRS